MERKVSLTDVAKKGGRKTGSTGTSKYPQRHIKFTLWPSVSWLEKKIILSSFHENNSVSSIALHLKLCFGFRVVVKNYRGPQRAQRSQPSR